MGPSRDKYDRNYYERRAYKAAPNSQRDRNRLQLILTHRSNGRLLEIGCATGEFLDLTSKHFEAYALDTSEYAINAVRSRHGERVWKADIEEETIPPGSYDCIVAFNVLEHLQDPERVIRKIHNGLADGGTVFGSVPNNGGAVGTPVTAFTNVMDKTHCSTYPTAKWEQLFRAAGFRRVVFLGEITFGKNRNVYFNGRLWRQLAFNAVFVCEK